MDKCYSAATIGQWFINKSIVDTCERGGEYITHLKLQKLLYYAQGCYGAMKGKRLFTEKIYNWTHGPVVKDLYDVLKVHKDKGITKYKKTDIDAETEAILEEVYNVFGQYSAWGLRNMTHNEDPWKNTKSGEEITFTSIVNYFKREIVQV